MPSRTQPSPLLQPLTLTDASGAELLPWQLHQITVKRQKLARPPPGLSNFRFACSGNTAVVDASTPTGIPEMNQIKRICAAAAAKGIPLPGKRGAHRRRLEFKIHNGRLKSRLRGTLLAALSKRLVVPVAATSTSTSSASTSLNASRANGGAGKLGRRRRTSQQRGRVVVATTSTSSSTTNAAAGTATAFNHGGMVLGEPRERTPASGADFPMAPIATLVM